MDLAKLSKQFLVSDAVPEDKLAELIEKLLPHCLVRKDGAVDIVRGRLSGKQLVKLVLAARAVASNLKGSSVSSEVSVKEIARFSDLPKDQAKARAKECVDEKFAERTSRGSYKARQQKLEGFLAELSGPGDSKVDR